MGLQYVVAKRIFGFDKDKNVKYVAKSVGAGDLVILYPLRIQEKLHHQ